jgi:mono/diheme cytochrome c family protein
MATVGGLVVRATTTAGLAAASAQDARTQWDGVYTEEQAQRGEPLYGKLCASCHGPELVGTDKVPPLLGPAFDGNWNDHKMGELSERIRMTMPVDNPGGLTRAQNADVLAFMLRKAGAPAGQTNLPTNVDQLNAIKYSRKPSAN